MLHGHNDTLERVQALRDHTPRGNKPCTNHCDTNFDVFRRNPPRVRAVEQYCHSVLLITMYKVFQP